MLWCSIASPGDSSVFRGEFPAWYLSLAFSETLIAKEFRLSIERYKTCAFRTISKG